MNVNKRRRKEEGRAQEASLETGDIINLLMETIIPRGIKQWISSIYLKLGGVL